MLSVRPKVAELVFQLYGRAASRSSFKSTAAARSNAAITPPRSTSPAPATWSLALPGFDADRSGDPAHHPLPQKRRLISYRLKGEGNDQMECRGGARYQVNFQLEPVEPEVFWTFQQELAHDGQRQGMLYRFDSSGRMAWEP